MSFHYTPLAEAFADVLFKEAYIYIIIKWILKY